MADYVEIVSPNSRPPFDIGEVTILKVIETKSATNLNPITPDEFALVGDVEELETIGPNGVAIPPLVGLATYGLEIGKDLSDTVCVEASIEGSGGETQISVDMHWFFSEDNGLNWYYFATVQIRETPAAGNPSGYTAAGEIVTRMFAVPVKSYNKYVAVAFLNNDTETVTVDPVRLVRQR
jgi:hypothetical protein